MTTIVLTIFNATCLVWGAVMLSRRARNRFRHVLVVMGVLLAGCGALALVAAGRIWPLLSPHPADTILAALPAALAISIVFGFLTVPLLRLTNPLGTIDPVLPAAVLGLTLGATVPASMGWQELSNGLLDRSAPIAVQGEITAKRQDWGVDGREYVVEVRIGERKEWLAVSRAEFEKREPGEAVTLSLGAGYQGRVWVRSVATENEKGGQDRPWTCSTPETRSEPAPRRHSVRRSRR